MNERFGILHLSDIHASEKTKVTIQRLVGLLKTDILDMQERYNVSIKMICITGDLINSGDDADIQLGIILDELLQPLMDVFNLDEKSIFVVAGNHEIKRKLIIPFIETGLSSTLVSEAAIDEFISTVSTDSLKRIEYFDSNFADMFGGDPVWKNPLGRAYVVTTDSIKIAFPALTLHGAQRASEVRKKGKW